jgi:protein SCO1/2
MSRVVGALLLAGALAGCRERATRPTAGASSAPPLATTPQDAASASPRGERSIYALPMTLTDQDGQALGLDVFRGRPVFVGMFYGTCPSACPLLVSTIKRTMSGIDGDAGAEVRVLLVSFDPERDTPAALHELAAHRGLDARWRLASAPEDQVRELAALLGIQYRRLPDGNFNHTSSIVLLDRKGNIDTRLDDVAQPVDPLVLRVKALAARP